MSCPDGLGKMFFWTFIKEGDFSMTALCFAMVFAALYESNFFAMLFGLALIVWLFQVFSRV
jgi:hypothetical protein